MKSLSRWMAALAALASTGAMAATAADVQAQTQRTLKAHNAAVAVFIGKNGEAHAFDAQGKPIQGCTLPGEDDSVPGSKAKLSPCAAAPGGKTAMAIDPASLHCTGVATIPFAGNALHINMPPGCTP